MIRGDKELIVVGDRVLIRLDELEERTEVGLYLPPTALEKENVQSGRVEEVDEAVAAVAGHAPRLRRRLGRRRGGGHRGERGERAAR